MSPNAHLHVLNPHVGVVLQADAACGLPVQVSSRMSPGMCLGGVSSFGYAGTISHAVLAYGLAGDGQAVAFGRSKEDESACNEAIELHAPKFGSRGSDPAGGGDGANLPEVPKSSTRKGKSALLEASSRTLPLSTASLQGIQAFAMMDSRQTMGPIVYRRLELGWCAPRHPFAYRNQPLSCSQDVIVRSSTVGLLHAAVADHIVQDRVIFPGAGYLEMTRATGAMALHGIYFLQPLAIEGSNLFVECAMSDGRIEVRSGASETIETIESATVHCSGEVAGASGWLRIDHPSVRGCSHAADVDSLYDGFDVVGLRYGPGYRTLLKAWGGGSDALARLHARSTHEGTEVHPADLDDAFCTSGAMAVSGGGETQLPFAVDDAQLQGTSGKLWAVRAFSLQPF